jgi:hypothetical protein
MENRTCSICGNEFPLDKEHFRWRVQNGKGYFTAECRACIAKEKQKAELRAKARQKAALDKIEAAGVDLFCASTVAGGSNIPHTAELVERVFGYFGGVGGFSSVLVKQYFDSPPGGTARNRLLETMCRLVTKNVEAGGAKKPLQLWSEEELEQELNQRLTEAVSSFKGVTIDGEAEIPKRLTQEAPEGDAAPASESGGHDAVPAGLDQGSPKRTARKAAGGSSALPPE